MKAPRLEESFWNGKHYAVVGVSRKKQSMGNEIAKELERRKYIVTKVNRHASRESEPNFVSSIEAIQPLPDGVIVCVPPEETITVVQQCIAKGVSRVWLQQGAESDEVISQCNEAKLEFVARRCAIMYLTPRKLPHSLHYFFASLFGKA